MGYSTKFQGVLFFDKDTPIGAIRILKELYAEDSRDHPEWGTFKDYFWIDLEVTKELDGLKWDGSEKSMIDENVVNFILKKVREEYPDFKLFGELQAQGEEIDDRWRLVIGEDGWAHKAKDPHEGKKVTCPHCNEDFYLKAGPQE